MTSEIAKAAAARVVLVASDEEALRRQAVEDLFQAIGIARDDFDLDRYDAEAAAPVTWLASAGTAPFLAPRRVVVVRHLLRRDPGDLPTGGLAALPETACLVLVVDEEIERDGPNPRRAAFRRGWEKEVKAAGGVVLAGAPDGRAVRSELDRRVKAEGLSFSGRAVDALIEMTGGSLSRALEELEKLRLYVGDRDQIREADVRAVVVPTREWSIFKMVDAIVGGDVAEAFRQLRTMVTTNTKAESAAFSQILPQTRRTLRLVWQARACVEANCTPNNAPASVRAAFPAKPNLAEEKDWRQEKLMGIARQVSTPGLRRAFAVLSDTDARLKGQLASSGGMETIERMVLELAAALARK